MPSNTMSNFSHSVFLCASATAAKRVSAGTLYLPASPHSGKPILYQLLLNSIPKRCAYMERTMLWDGTAPLTGRSAWPLDVYWSTLIQIMASLTTQPTGLGLLRRTSFIGGEGAVLIRLRRTPCGSRIGASIRLR